MTKHKYDSNEEWYWSWWLQEVEDAGYIHGLKYQPKSFNICDPVKIGYKGYGKRKGIFDKEVTILRGSEYTADWFWYWTPKAIDIFFTINPAVNPKDFPFFVNTNNKGPEPKYFSVVDVKGSFDPNNNIRMFAMNQKMIYKLHKIYVQAIVPKPSVKTEKKDEESPLKLIVKPQSALFLTTFTPRRYLLTDKDMTPRKIQFKTRSLNEFVNEQRNKMALLPGQLQTGN